MFTAFLPKLLLFLGVLALTVQETEKINMETLNKYRLMEAEKKKTVLRKQTYCGAFVSTLSTTRVLPDGSKEARTFLTFSDLGNYKRVGLA